MFHITIHETRKLADFILQPSASRTNLNGNINPIQTKTSRTAIKWTIYVFIYRIELMMIICIIWNFNMFLRSSIIIKFFNYIVLKSSLWICNQANTKRVAHICGISQYFPLQSFNRLIAGRQYEYFGTKFDVKKRAQSHHHLPISHIFGLRVNTQIHNSSLVRRLTAARTEPILVLKSREHHAIFTCEGTTQLCASPSKYFRRRTGFVHGEWSHKPQ